MPYRRLPNTDKARIRSLERAVSAMRKGEYYRPVVQPELLSNAERILRQFSDLSDRYNSSLEEQLAFSRSELYQTRLRSARMYVSHFITVFNLSVKRGEIKRNERAKYHLPEDCGETPDLSSDVSLIRWGDNVVRGEHQRTAGGGIPIYNPTIGKVSVHLDLFKELYNRQMSLKQRTDECLAVVTLLRPQVDEIILEVWNSIESYFSDLEGDSRINACREFGVIYYYRKGEKSTLVDEEPSSPKIDNL